jgi:hypothetical protein
MKKLLDSLRLAVPRFLLGTVGMWCTLGPIMLLHGSGSASQGHTTLLVLLLILCYAVVLIICLRAKWDALKELVSETTLALCFMIIGLLVNEITGIFIAVKHKLVIVYAFVGFLIAEVIKPKVLIKTLAGFTRGRTAAPLEPGNEVERSEKHSSAELIMLSVQKDNRQLQEIIDGLKDQLKASESRLEQSRVRIEEAFDLGAILQTEIAILKQRLAEREGSIETLRRAAQHAVKLQSENQEFCIENRSLQEELKSHRVQLSASEIRLEELARRHKEVSDRYDRLEAEVADLKRRLKDSQRDDLELKSARRQLANVESREMASREQQHQQHEALLAALSERTNRVQVLGDSRPRLWETERVCQELAEVNRRRWPEVSATRSLNNAAQEARGDQSHSSTGGLAAAIHGEKHAEASRLVWTSAKRQMQFGAIAAVVVIAGVVAMGVLRSKVSAPKEVAVVPETSFQEYAVQAVSKAQKKPAPRLRGTFETVRPTQVYTGPSENSALIADIGAGMKLNVVGSSYGWLEIRSRHGRPPGFIRQEATVRIAQN